MRLLELESVNFFIVRPIVWKTVSFSFTEKKKKVIFVQVQGREKQTITFD